MENNNNLVIALASILSVLGSRYLIDEIEDSCKNLLSSTIVKKMILFSILFINTKDWRISFIITLLYSLIVNGIINKKN